MGPALNRIQDFVGRIGARRLALMGGVAVLLLGGLAYLSMRGGSAEMGYLYTDLDPSAAQSIVERLRTDNVPFQLSADGTAVMAPQDKLPELRMSLASESLGGRIGYAVLDQEEAFGVSSSRARLNETRAIEGELAQSIQSLENVLRARVHIVMPERAVFSSEPRRATAAVTVKTRGRLPGESVQAIRHLVASSVPELAPESVSIVDHTGALLARAGEAGAAGGADADERQQAIESRLRQQIEAMLEPIVGAGKVRAEVAAVIDRDQLREESSLVDPDRQAIARQTTVESNDQSSESEAAAEGATVAEQLPEAEATPAGAGSDSRRSARNETSEEIAYENSRTNTLRVRNPGTLNRLTVAVMVDGGQQGIPQQQLQRLQRLVENAVGFSAERGDSVVVESMPFTAADLGEVEESWMDGLPTDQLFGLLKLLIIAGVALLVVRMLRPKQDRRDAGPGQDLLAAQMAQPLAIGGENAEGSEQAAITTDPPSMLDQEISLAQVDGRIKLSAINRIGETVSKSPMEATSVIRQWMAA